MYQLKVGFGRRELVPQESIPLGGYGNEGKRFHTEIGERVYLSCIAVTDETEKTVLMFGGDFVACLKDLGRQIRSRVSQATGVPEDHITVSATHTHAGASLKRYDFDCVLRFLDDIYVWAIEAAREALEDRKPAVMRTGSIETKDLNFVKHYTVLDEKTGEVSYAGDIFGTFKERKILGHATPVDPTMHLLQFVREGGKDIVLCNFRAHPHFHGGSNKYVYSSDYMGAYRRAFEYMAGCYTVFFQGACGNTNSSTRIQEERRYSTCESYGMGLAATAMECLQKNMEDVEAGPIRTVCRTYRAPLWQCSEELVENAKKIREIWLQNYSIVECRRAGKPLGIRSNFHANSILARQERVPEDGDVLMNAVSIGDSFAFVTFPGEMFDTLSMRLEHNSPFPMTMMFGYSQDHLGYLPSELGYVYTSYETDVTRFAPGTGEKISDFQVEMLRELKK